MTPVMLNLLTSMLALGLTVVAFAQLVTGRALGQGYALRAALEPALSAIRASSSLTRAELADRTMLAAAALGAAGTIVQRSPVGVVLVAMLLGARPLVRRATREEHRLLAVASSFSTDLVVGFYLPMTLAQVLVRSYLFAASMAAVMVALCWPAGGGEAVPGRRWRLAPVTS